MLYDDRLTEIMRTYENDESGRHHALHTYARDLLQRHEIDKAWQVLLAGE
jgi:hypothetical protein